MLGYQSAAKHRIIFEVATFTGCHFFCLATLQRIQNDLLHALAEAADLLTKPPNAKWG